jgi:fido (protein-threonine AMPylation protein)
MPRPATCPEWSRPESAAQLPYVVSGMTAVTKFTYRHAKTHILTHGDLKEWHRTIFEKVVPMNYYAGNFRSNDPQRPCLAVNVEVSSNAGSPFGEVPALMKEFSQDLESFTKRTDTFIRSGTTPIYRARASVQLAAFSAGKLIQIHPFVNGNGRISRQSANYFLHRYGYRFAFEHPHPRPSDPSYSAAAADCMRGDYGRMYAYLLMCLTA